MIAALSQAIPVEDSPIIFLLPAWLAGTAIASRHPAILPLHAAVSSISLLYQRFGHVLLILVVQWLLSVGCAILGGAVGYLLAGLGESIEGIPTLGMEGALARVGGALGYAFGFELGATVAVATLISLLTTEGETSIAAADAQSPEGATGTA
jgi:hypothetical protein